MPKHPTGKPHPAFLLLAALVPLACAHSGPGARSEGGALKVVGVGANLDPTLRPARLVPETVERSGTYGNEAGGGVRTITSGLRVVTTNQGSVLAADDRLPQDPSSTTALPERLGGGFLFVLGSTVWRADRWLGSVKPIFTSTQPIQSIVPGLDRVYARANNTYLALDGRTGQALDLGPWPQSPFVASYAAADAWRAAAIVDLRGVVATFDAGASWRTLDLPCEARQIVVSGESLVAFGFEPNRTEAWFEIRADGSISRLATPPRDSRLTMAAAPARPSPTFTFPTIPIPPPPPSPAPTASAPKPPSRDTPSEDAALRIFGKRPLVAAIEDGWPLTDGTAVVARDGALARVRLSDGAVTEMAPSAFPLKPSRCHPVSLTRPNAVGAFGFVCGETRGATVIYAFDPFRGRLTEIKRFDKPRVVTPSGNGALAVRGGCAEDAEQPAPPRPELLENKKDKERDAAPASAPLPEVHPWCVLGHDNTWREVHVRGEVGDERVVVLTDGRVVVVSPPQGPSLPARVTVLDKGKAQTAAVVFPKVAADVARVLRLGLWLDGFEERRPGVVGGWLEAGGTMLGIEIALDGKATPGQFIRDAGLPFVAGKYGFGWTGARRGYETTDGGMTWVGVDLPDALNAPGKVERRACGPIGCIASGWLRIGWGDPRRPPPPPAPAPAIRTGAAVAAPQLALTCEPLAGTPPIPNTPSPRVEATPTPTSPTLGLGRRYPSGPPVLSAATGLATLSAFYTQPGPALRDAERGLQYDVRELTDRYNNQTSPFARIYAWGPKTGDWDTQGRWQVRWISPFAGWPEIRASAPVLPPPVIVELTRTGSSPFGYGGGYYPSAPYYPGGYGNQQASVAAADDTNHALVTLRRPSNRAELVLFELEADRPPLEIRRADGEPFGELEGFVRTSGRWFFASAAQTATPTTTIWQVDGAVARELVRIPRAGGFDTGRTMTGARLARRSDGRALGLVVDGQSNGERNTSTPIRWVLPIDLETGALGEPESLGYNDLGGRTLEACTDEIVGWNVDAPLGIASVRVKLPKASGSITQGYGRLRLTTARACVERILGMYDGQSAERAAELTRPGAARRPQPPQSGEILASIVSAQERHPLRCTVAR